jgi:hypothetical protein
MECIYSIFAYALVSVERNGFLNCLISAGCRLAGGHAIE